MAAPPWTTVMASIWAPRRQISPVSPATMPSLMMSALRVGRDSAATVSTILSSRIVSRKPL